MCREEADQRKPLVERSRGLLGAAPGALMLLRNVLPHNLGGSKEM